MRVCVLSLLSLLRDLRPALALAPAASLALAPALAFALVIASAFPFCFCSYFSLAFAPKCVCLFLGAGLLLLGVLFFVKGGADSRGVLERSPSRDPLRNPCRKLMYPKSIYFGPTVPI